MTWIARSTRHINFAAGGPDHGVDTDRLEIEQFNLRLLSSSMCERRSTAPLPALKS